MPVCSSVPKVERVAALSAFIYGLTLIPRLFERGSQRLSTVICTNGINTTCCVLPVKRPQHDVLQVCSSSFAASTGTVDI